MIDNRNPPRFFHRFLQWFCPAKLYEGIEGDLVEEFEKELNKGGRTRAKIRFAFSVLLFFRPGIILRNRFSWQLNPMLMVRNYITVASRNMLRQKFYTFIHVAGLSIGISFCLLIYYFVRDEQSFDQFHLNKDRIYALVALQYNKEKAAAGDRQPFVRYSYSQPVLAPTIKAELPDAEYVTRLSNESGIVRYLNKTFNERIVYADSDFFKMFSFPLLSGNASKLFQDKGDAVVTPAFAQKYFGSESPLGKTISITTDAETLYTVAGIMEAAPFNSSIDYGIIVPMESYPGYENSIKRWGNFSVSTLVQLMPEARASVFTENLDKVIQKNMSDLLLRWRDASPVPQQYKPFQFNLVNLNDLHMQKELGWYKVSDPRYTWILSGIAILTLVIGCINYISLALTASAARQKEVGIRKTIGAGRRQLFSQFSFESLLVALLSTLSGLVLAFLFLPAFNDFTGKNIRWEEMNVIGVSIATIVLTGIVGMLAGSYPALYLSGFRPASVLKGASTRLKASFTRPLVVLQFVLSAFLIISALIMLKQMNFIASRNLGYKRDHILVIPTQTWNEEAHAVADRFKSRVEAIPSVISATKTNYSFTRGLSYYAAAVYVVDADYINTLGIELIQGRNFNAANAADSKRTVIVNETLVKERGLENPLNEYIKWGDDTVASRIIGVVKDYHFRSLEHEISPMLLTMEPIETPGFVLINVQNNDVANALEQIKKAWLEISPDKPFEYSFLDADVASQYASYQRWMAIMERATFFAVLIACLGLFGLAGINAVNRTKEIGIRKVMGAGLYHIFILLNKQYVMLAVIAFTIAIPLSWIIMEQWLESFKYAVDISWEMFGLSLAVGLAVALLAVSYHAIKTALINPAETLKYE